MSGQLLANSSPGWDGLSRAFGTLIDDANGASVRKWLRHRVSIIEQGTRVRQHLGAKIFTFYASASQSMRGCACLANSADPACLPRSRLARSRLAR